MSTEPAAGQFKEAARKLKRSATMKQSEALNRVARHYGYNSWGHVKWCINETNSRISRGQNIKTDLIAPSELSFTTEIEYIVQCAEMGAQTVVGLKTCILFSTFDSDAWLLDATTNQALCLVWRGARQPFRILETLDTFVVQYDAVYSVNEDNFVVSSDNPAIGNRVIGFCYPTDEINDFTNRIQHASRVQSFNSV